MVRLFHLFLFLLSTVSAKSHGNPADDLVDIINKNRTAHKVPTLQNNPGLGCMALQYTEHCERNCSKNNTLTCKTQEEDIVEVFAPNCGVELPTVNIISGHIVGCWYKYLEPSEIFGAVLVREKKALSFILSKEHKEVGVGLSSSNGKPPFFWCVLFSSGARNSSFVLDVGLGIKENHGCFSGKGSPCSGVKRYSGFSNDVFALFLVMLMNWLVAGL
ncbi:hypothetical protein AMTRI_Chr03g52010 [Amborella trichopoda]|uniref:uncharacterized protein LOC18429086 isoform X1 n=1 Tax=Amborella trichopoda TaxID=13333 RepID=UPI0005D3F081|nr:uncharacterized protein LOC18429086 isoform X1 [Amborella trichopoda]|eukprot:XP_011621475.1 uncharacterized protein LOC18429086 isoform X1 [Amborella trichopoda]